MTEVEIADLMKRAEAGDLESMHEWACVYKAAEAEGDTEAAKACEEAALALMSDGERRLLRKMAIADSTDAMLELAWAYSKGIGVRKNLRKAKKLHKTRVSILQDQAENGDPQAMFELGRAYEKGWGVEVAPAIAQQWFAKARTARA